MPDDIVFVVATYRDVAEARGDHEALLRFFDELGRPNEADAVTLGRRASGEARFDSEGPRAVAGTGLSSSLAAGLAAALFPSVGADVPASRVTELAVLGVVAGQVGRAVGRTDLMMLGDHLDRWPAGLIVAAPIALDDPVQQVLRRASSMRRHSVSIDVVGLQRAIHTTRVTT